MTSNCKIRDFFLGRLREVQGKLAEAETLHRQALALRQKSPGNNYLDLVNSMVPENVDETVDCPLLVIRADVLRQAPDENV